MQAFLIEQGSDERVGVIQVPLVCVCVRGGAPAVGLMFLCWRQEYLARPWLVELAKRRARILLVTGFAASIHRQLPRLATVHPDLELAPLRVRLLRTPLDAFREPRHREYPDWAAALAALEASDEWDATRSDVALLGCGAFGMPLAAHARSRGLAALYVGGRLPTLFGVVGRYDRKLPQVRARINQHWIAPLPEETPEAARASSHESHGYWDDV